MGDEPTGFSCVHTRDRKSPFHYFAALRHVCDDVMSLDVESLSECGPWNQ